MLNNKLFVKWKGKKIIFLIHSSDKLWMRCCHRNDNGLVLIYYFKAHGVVVRVPVLGNESSPPDQSESSIQQGLPWIDIYKLVVVLIVPKINKNLKKNQEFLWVINLINSRIKWRSTVAMATLTMPMSKHPFRDEGIFFIFYPRYISVHFLYKLTILLPTILFFSSSAVSESQLEIIPTIQR